MLENLYPIESIVYFFIFILFNISCEIPYTYLFMQFIEV